jgi:hypothetical protein
MGEVNGHSQDGHGGGQGLAGRERRDNRATEN